MYNFEINNDKLRISPQDPFGDGNELIIYLDKFDGEKWNPLCFPTMYSTEVANYENTISKLNECYQEINIKLEEMYGKGSNVPESGFDLVRYLIDNKTSSEDNKLKINE